MIKEDPTKALIYRSYASAVKEKVFVRQALEEKLRVGNIAIFTLSEVQYLEGLWLSPLESIPKTGQKICLIYDFFGVA